jgi:hypothetical protein
MNREDWCTVQLRTPNIKHGSNFFIHIRRAGGWDNCWLTGKVSLLVMQALDDVSIGSINKFALFASLNFFGGLQCVLAMVTPLLTSPILYFWEIRTQRAAIASRRSTNLATHHPKLGHPMLGVSFFDTQYRESHFMIDTLWKEAWRVSGTINCHIPGGKYQVSNWA